MIKAVIELAGSDAFLVEEQLAIFEVTQIEVALLRLGFERTRQISEHSLAQGEDRMLPRSR